MTDGILAILRAAVGDDAAAGADGKPRVAPRSVDGLAAALGTIHRHGWKVRVEGRRTWMPADAPAEVAITTERLGRIPSLAPADLVATVQAGVPMRYLASQLAAHRTWLALDPPGSPDRTLGSVLATATAGPSAHRFGTVRDHVLGTTVATADGRLVKAGGIVVKNVAGYDLSKIQIGGFGAFGIIAEANVRLRALPAVRRTLIARGELDPLFLAARAIAAGNVDTTILELFGEAGGRWQLVVETAGTEPGTAAEEARARALAGIPLEPAAGGAVVAAFGESFTEAPVTLRAGALPASLPDVADLVTATVGAGRFSLSVGRGGLRWSGRPTIEGALALRRELATREIPLTVERAPWSFRQAVGHFGQFREGVRPLSGRVREVFDAAGVLVVPLEGTRNG